MENFKALKKLLSEIEQDIKSISKAKTFQEVDTIEYRCVHGIPMAQRQTSLVFNDLYEIASAKRKELRDRPVIVQEDKPVEKKAESKPKSTKKKKTTTKKK